MSLNEVLEKIKCDSEKGIFKLIQSIKNVNDLNSLTIGIEKSEIGNLLKLISDIKEIANQNSPYDSIKIAKTTDLLTSIKNIEKSGDNHALIKNICASPDINLLNFINYSKCSENINFYDENNKNILHYLMEAIQPKSIDTDLELCNVVDTIKQLVKIMSENAINAIDDYGNTPLNLASKCRYEEISWAVLDTTMPSYIKKSFKPVLTYNHTFNSFIPYSYPSSTKQSIEIAGGKDDTFDNFEHI